MPKQTVAGFVDSASMYEVIAALSFSEVDERYPWAWQSSLLVSDAPIDIDVCSYRRRLPHPGARQVLRFAYGGRASFYGYWSADKEGP